MLQLPCSFAWPSDARQSRPPRQRAPAAPLVTPGRAPGHARPLSPAGVNRKVVYSLADSADGFFSVDSSSGIVVLERPLDREQQSSYTLRVRATDQSPGRALSSLATVSITVLDVNDNPPVFERRDYLVSVPEDTSPGTQVLAVFATSKDIGTNAEITYLIRSGNEQGRFRINPKTGG